MRSRVNKATKKKLRFKKRRSISKDELFKRRMDTHLLWMDYSIRQAFPDPVERQKYIKDLIKGLEEEETCELTIRRLVRGANDDN